MPEFDVRPNSELEPIARLFESRYGLVLEAARRYVLDAELAHDVVQQTFLVFMQGIVRKKWTVDQNVNLLLYGIAKRVALEIRGREKKHTPEALADLEEYLHEKLLQSDVPLEDKGLSDRVAALEQCMQRIPEKSRLLFEQHYRDNRTTEELSRQSDIPAGTLRKTFSRIRVMLRDCIEKKRKEP